MARATLKHTVVDEGRDKDKVFLITEMPASRGEAWATRALLALMANGSQLPAGFERMGMAGIAEIGLKMLAGLRWEVAAPLLEEMWTCVQMIPDPSRPNIVRPLIEEDIEEITTRVKLRVAIWKLHTDFLKAAALSMSDDLAAAGNDASQTTKTSPK